MRTIREVFAENLREIRGNRTQAYMAEAVGISLSTYQKMELGNVPQAHNLEVLANGLGVPETRLFFDSDLVTQPTPEQALEVLATVVKSKPPAALPGTEDFDDQEIRMLQAAVDAIRSQREPSSTRKKRENHSG